MPIAAVGCNFRVSAALKSTQLSAILSSWQKGSHTGEETERHVDRRTEREREREEVEIIKGCVCAFIINVRTRRGPKI